MFPSVRAAAGAAASPRRCSQSRSKSDPIGARSRTAGSVHLGRVGEARREAEPDPLAVGDGGAAHVQVAQLALPVRKRDQAVLEPHAEVTRLGSARQARAVAGAPHDLLPAHGLLRNAARHVHPRHLHVRGVGCEGVAHRVELRLVGGTDTDPPQLGQGGRSAVAEPARCGAAYLSHASMLAQMPGARPGAYRASSAATRGPASSSASRTSRVTWKLGQQIGRHGIAGGRLEPPRVHVAAILRDPETHVGAGGEAGLPHVADHLLLLHRLPDGEPLREARQVGVVRHVAVVVTDLDQVPEAACPAPIHHPAVGHRPQRAARGRHVVDAVVRPRDLENRVEARGGKTRADPAEAERRQQELPLDGAPVGPVVAASALLQLEVDARCTRPPPPCSAPPGCGRGGRRPRPRPRRCGRAVRRGSRTHRRTERCARSRRPRRRSPQSRWRAARVRRAPPRRRAGSTPPGPRCARPAGEAPPSPRAAAQPSPSRRSP